MTISELRNPPDLYVSNRFLKSMYRSGLRRDMVLQAMWDVVRTYVSQPFPLHGLDRVAGFNEPLYELKISGGDRAILHWEDSRLSLLDVGDHETIPRYSRAKLDTDLESLQVAPAIFSPEVADIVLPRGDGIVGVHYGQENTGLWSITLDSEQTAVLAEIQQSLLSSTEPRVHVILGGPGTGKTAILFAAVRFARDMGLEFRLSANDVVCDYLEMSLLEELDSNRGTAWDSVDALFLDDPFARHEIRTAVITYASGGGGVAVIGVDPLQISDEFYDSDVSFLQKHEGVRVHWLRTCYRQKSDIGQPVLQMLDQVAFSAANVARSDQPQAAVSNLQLAMRINAMDLINPGGYFRVYDPCSEADLRVEVERIIASADSLWKHWHNVLIVTEDGCGLEVDLCGPGVDSETALLSEMLTIKGAEYQHGFVLLSGRTFDAMIHGFHEADDGSLRIRRLMRIPLTRTKDSLVIAVAR